MTGQVPRGVGLERKAVDNDRWRRLNIFAFVGCLERVRLQHDDCQFFTVGREHKILNFTLDIGDANCLTACQGKHPNLCGALLGIVAIRQETNRISVRTPLG